MSTSSIVWTGAIVTLALISFVFRSDNPAYRLAQNAFLGVAAGHSVVVAWKTLGAQAFKPLMSGNALFIVPLVFGLLLFSRFVRGFEWLARYPMAVLIASGAGIGLAGAVQAQLLAQINATAQDLTNINNLILFVGVLVVVCFFFMTNSYAKHLRSGPGGMMVKLGRWVMMIGFGATFGNTVMGRLTLLIGRLQFLLGTWLGVLR